MFVWVFHRVSGLMLIVLIGLKIVTGYAFTGKWGDEVAQGFGTWHKSPWLDVPLFLLLLGHILYGVRTILADLGVKREKELFWAATALGVVLYGVWAFWAYGR